MTRKLTLCLLLIFSLVALNSCKKERSDLSGLLGTVPSSASGVIGIHVKSLLEDIGCQVKGNEVKPGKELDELLKNAASNRLANFLTLFDGSAGIVPDCAVIFFASNRTFLTFPLYDVATFCKTVEEQQGVSFTDAGAGVRLCGNIAVKGAQAWLCLTPLKTIDPDDISFYAGLTESQSFLNTDLAKDIVDSDDDIVGWGQFKSLLQGTLSRSDLTYFNLLSGFIFEDATAVSFSLDFEKGELEGEALILNDKGKAAKYLLPSEKVNVETLKQLGGSADALLALTITPKLVEKISKIGTAIGGSLFDNLTGIFKNIDGTIGIAISGQGTSDAVAGVITTKGDVSQDLRDMISSQIGPVQEQGNLLTFSNSPVSGSLQISELAEMLKGSCIGFATGMQFINANSKTAMPSSFKSMAVKLEPEGKGLELKFEVKGTDPKENILYTILKANL